MRRFLTIGAAVLAGCFEGLGTFSDVGGGNGLAENGEFTYVCSSEADPHCDEQSSPEALPAVLARGSRFDMRFRGTRDARPVSSRAVRDVAPEEFETLVAGNIGFVVLSGDEGIDALRLTVAEPDGLAIGSPNIETPGWSRWSAGSEQRLGLGKKRLRAVALVGSSTLAGTLTGLTWTVDPPEVATIEENAGVWELSTLRPGSATVRVTRGELSSVARIVVTDEPTPDPLDGGAGDGGDADAEIDGGDP